MTSALTVTFNAREISGLPLSGGATLKPGVLFRSDALSGLTPEGGKAFAQYRIGTVLDLRTVTESGAAADILPTDGSVRLVALSILGGDMEGMVRSMVPAENSKAPSEAQLAELAFKVPTLDDLYIEILSSSASQFAEVGRAVIAASRTDRPGVLFHCTAGKDRTGIAAALLLLVAGATRADIVADYTQTETNLATGFAEHLLGLISGYGIPMTPGLRALATESPASAIEGAMDWVETNYGDAAAYLASGGLSADELSELQQALRDS